MSVPYSSSSSKAEDLFIELFSEAFGAEKAGYLYSQYHFCGIYQNSRYADFVMENNRRRIAIGGVTPQEPGGLRKILRRSAEAEQHDLHGLGRVLLGSAADAAPAGVVKV